MKRLGVGYTTIKNWQYGWRFRKIGHKQDQYCPVWALKKLCKIYSETMGADLESVLRKVERNIYAYRAHSGTKVTRPKLPIQESPELYSIMAHMVADGTWSDGLSAQYANSSSMLRMEFVNNLKKVFGEVHIHKSFTKGRTPAIQFPSAVMYILSSHFQFKFSGIRGLPRYILGLPLEFKGKMLRAFFDDEGYVHDSNIQICSADIEMLKILRLLLKSLKIETSELRPYQDHVCRDGRISKVFYLNIYSKSVPVFAKRVGFSHPKKSILLDLIMKIKLRGKYPDRQKVESTIISELKKNGPLTARDLSLKSIITARNLRKNYLHPLEKRGFIKKNGKKPGKGGALLWAIKK